MQVTALLCTPRGPGAVRRAQHRSHRTPRTRGAIAFSLVLITLTLALTATPATAATCGRAVPGSWSWTDDPADGASGLAPEIVGVTARVWDDCDVGIAVALANRTNPGDLLADESVGIYLDTDGNSATGSSTWNGADALVLFMGAIGEDYPPYLIPYRNGDFDTSAASELTPATAVGFIARADVLGITPGAVVGVRTIAMWSGVYDAYSDFAPEPWAASFAMPVSYAEPSPPPPPAPAPPPPSTPAPAPAPPSASRPSAPAPPSTSTPTGSRGKRPCVVPRLRGLTRSRAARKLKRARCRYRFVWVRSSRRRGSVVSTSPRAGTRTARVVTVRLSRGRRRARAASAMLAGQIERVIKLQARLAAARR